MSGGWCELGIKVRVSKDDNAVGLTLILNWRQLFSIVVVVGDKAFSCRRFARALELLKRAQNLRFIENHLHFYRAMLCIRGTNHGPVSVRPSVCHKSEFY